MTRSVPEWIGKTDDEKVPERVQLRIWRSQMDGNGDVHCYMTGDIISVGDDAHLDHKIALILGGQHRESNLGYCLTKYHRMKTAEEVAVRAGNDARAKSHAGIKTTERTGLEGRTPQQRRAAKERRSAEAGKFAMPPRRPLFVEEAPKAPAPILALPAPKSRTA